ncbi:MAG: YfhO family protein [Cyclobacteriaceae bacterium]|nr:YfhO family protein [Cyclobacteriaceae bacterium]
MKKLKFSEHVLPHLIAVAVFLIVTVLFFSPVFFDHQVLSQHDIQQNIGSAKDLRDFRDATGEEGLWAQSMFSGMPAYLVSLQWSNGPVVFLKHVLTVWLPHPVNNLMAAFVCYYILLLAFRVRPSLAMAGALAFGLSTFFIIGLEAGHNARVGAIAFMPLVVAGIHLVFSGQRWLGFAVTSGGLALHLRENHLQITYYLMLIVVVYGLVQLMYAVRERQISGFVRSIALLVPAALIAVGTFFGPIWAISEYTTYSIRGKSELVKPGAPPAADGLSRDYAFAYNYGIWEPVTLLVPDIYGGTSREAFVQDTGSASYKALMQAGDQQTANQLAAFTVHYWGPQHGGTLGAYYAGAIIVFLFVFGALVADRKWFWWLMPLGLLSLMLSWGDSFPTFNYFIFDHLPGYNKFRSVNFALVIILFAMPLLGFLGVEKYLNNAKEKVLRRSLLIAAACTGGVCLLLVLTGGLGSLSRPEEQELPGWFLSALKADRSSLIRSDAFRSFSFIAGIFLLLYFEGARRMSSIGFYAVFIFLTGADLIAVNKRYLTKENYQRSRVATFEPTEADNNIRRDQDYYRVYNLDLNSSWAEARTSYFHHSLGGYHGAKLRRYQDLYDSCLAPQTRTFFQDAQSGRLDYSKYGIFNMLNARYLVYGSGAGDFIRNPAALGNAWFVGQAEAVTDANAELKRTGEINPAVTAIVHQSSGIAGTFQSDSSQVIKLTGRKPYLLQYESESGSEGLAVFSEIYYPRGWHATIDGAEVPIVRANYVLRALKVPAGKHVIEFRFEPAPYVIGDKITMASSWLVLLLVVGAMGWNIRKEVA